MSDPRSLEQVVADLRLFAKIIDSTSGQSGPSSGQLDALADELDTGLLKLVEERPDEGRETFINETAKTVARNLKGHQPEGEPSEEVRLAVLAGAVLDYLNAAYSEGQLDLGGEDGELYNFANAVAERNAQGGLDHLDRMVEQFREHGTEGSWIPIALAAIDHPQDRERCSARSPLSNAGGESCALPKGHPGHHQGVTGAGSSSWPQDRGAK